MLCALHNGNTIVVTVFFVNLCLSISSSSYAGRSVQQTPLDQRMRDVTMSDERDVTPFSYRLSEAEASELDELRGDKARLEEALATSKSESEVRYGHLQRHDRKRSDALSCRCSRRRFYLCKQN